MAASSATPFVPAPPDAETALLVVDVQNDFLPGGALAVADGDAIVPLINKIAGRYRTVVLTQDWHPAGHISFASSHPGRNPFEIIDLPYGPQVLWPDHCVQGGTGAAFAPGLEIPHAQLILRKGGHADVDSYSAFVEADRLTTTGLAAWLRAREITTAHVCGLATDFCVAWTALDAAAEGLRVTVIEDAARAIDANGSLAAAWTAMTDAGVSRARAEDLHV